VLSGCDAESRSDVAVRVLRAAAKNSDNGGQATEEADPAVQTARQTAWVQANEQVFDKLIDLFREKSRDDNRKLIAYSKQWPSLSDGVFYRSHHRPPPRRVDTPCNLKLSAAPSKLFMHVQAAGEDPKGDQPAGGASEAERSSEIHYQRVPLPLRHLSNKTTLSSVHAGITSLLPL
jgi:hypothetical protein